MTSHSKFRLERGVVLITQGKNDWYKDALNGKITVKNIGITDGGLVHVYGEPNKGDIITLKNVYNEKSTGKYFVMCWPQNPDGSQVAFPKLIWENDPQIKEVKQGPNEAAFRGKIDDAFIAGVHFRAYLKDGKPWKQIVQVRHGKKWVFQQCHFIDGWVDVGQQKTAQPDGSSKYETSQHVGSVTFDGCYFHKMPGKNTYVSRQPGVEKIVFSNCFDPSGKKFSKTI